MIEKINNYLRHQTTTGIQLHELDAFRGWAVLGVFLIHSYQAYSGILEPGATSDVAKWAFKYGYLGLDLFFFISGFLLFIKWGKAHYENRPMPDKLAFYKRRILRIVPAYYLNLLVVLILCALSDAIGRRYVINGVYDVLSHVFFLQNLSPYHDNTINPVMWSLAPEFQFYLILPFFASWFFGRRWIIALPLIVAFTLMFRFGVVDLLGGGPLPVDLKRVMNRQLASRLSEFAVGMCFANLWLYMNTEKARPVFLAAKKFAAAMVVAGIGLLFLYCYVDAIGAAFRIRYSLHSTMLPFSFGLVIFGTLYSGLFKRLLSNGIMQFIGIISYSLYLWHHVVIKVLSIYVEAPKGQGVAYFSLYIGMAFSIAVALSMVSYLVSERPFLKIKPQIVMDTP